MKVGWSFEYKFRERRVERANDEWAEKLRGERGAGKRGWVEGIEVWRIQG